MKKLETTYVLIAPISLFIVLYAFMAIAFTLITDDHRLPLEQHVKTLSTKIMRNTLPYDLFATPMVASQYNAKPDSVVEDAVEPLPVVAVD